ncbi:energy transducer TonB [Marinobacterium rhizophilum]|uniref:Protein TonB n=1 Tax=Marinobacterium rhizophilum TaxID=420402 RepID=A0ABY5HCL1_9GAMM|nr:energy transducer TonB [Marinobacterium rhizophilum]UTW10080.1 energy transducer TonB [Marinobacterium rhizophilum]
MIRPHHWMIALGIALGVHLVALGLVLAREPAEGARAPGEQGIEIDLGMLGDLGAQTQNQQAAEPEPAPETPVEVPQPEIETPAAPPTPEPEPEAMPEPVTAKQTPELTVKPKPKPQPKPRPVAAKPATTEPVAAPAPAQTRSDTGSDSSESRRMTTGSQNALSSGGNPGAEQSYYALIAARLAQHKRYPIRARRKGEEGIARLFFILDRQGSVIEYRLTESSGHKTLDRAVINMLKSATPLPAFPADMTMETLTINIPVAFSIN